jgi:hypothetical protein
MLFPCAALVLSACSPTIRTPPPSGTGTGGMTGGGIDAAVDQPAFRDVYVAPDTIVSTDGACAAQSANAEPVPLDLYVMMDSSKSMLEVAGTGTSTTKWQMVSAALTGFLNDPQSKGLGVGIQYFPQIQANVPVVCDDDPVCGAAKPCNQHKTCVRNGKTTTAVAPFCLDKTTCTGTDEDCKPIGTCPTSDPTGYCAPVGSKCAGGDTCTAIGYCQGRDVCDQTAYAAPAVEIATLPGAAGVLVASLDARMPDGHTPTGPALQGALQHAQARAQAMPEHKVAVLFVTDGLPDGCPPTDLPTISGYAAAAVTGAMSKPAVPTFVIGVFSPNEAAMASTNLNMLASSGGTGSAVVINTNQSEAEVRQALQTALSQIRTKALACEYKIPPPTMGAIDVKKVNVEYTAGTGGSSTIGYVPSASACTATKGGWHYDVDPDMGGKPTAIVACPSTCTQFQADMAGRVDIQLGCVTITIQ